MILCLVDMSLSVLVRSDPLQLLEHFAEIFFVLVSDHLGDLCDTDLGIEQQRLRFINPNSPEKIR